MAWFLPSRRTLAYLLFFTLLNILTRLITSSIFYWIIRLTASHYFHKWEKRFNKPVAPRRGWWGCIQQLFVLPWLGARFADLGGKGMNIAFYLYSRQHSVADACYSVIDIPGFLDLSDPHVLYKSNACSNRHSATRTDIAEASRAFRFLYRSGGSYSLDVFNECKHLIVAFWGIDTGECNLNYLSEFTETYLDAQDRCLHVNGEWTEQEAETLRQTGQEMCAKLGHVNGKKGFIPSQLLKQAME